jgi:hypothetical protein
MVRFDDVCPILSCRDVGAALEHYRRLGFEATAYDDAGEGAPEYGFLARDAVRLHVSRIKGHDPATNDVAAYLYVDDADALLSEWRAADVGGRLEEAYDTEYGLREFCHIDPDGNLLRIGSRP